MNTLLVTRCLEDGAKKTYRFSAEERRFVVGSSRKADLRLPKNDAQAIEGVIERHAGGWSYHSFVVSEDPAPVISDLSKTREIKVGKVRLQFQILPDVSLFSAPDTPVAASPPTLGGAYAGTDLGHASQFQAPAKPQNGDTGGPWRQIVLVYRDGHLITSRTWPVGTKCLLDLYTTQLQIETKRSPEWSFAKVEDYEIRQKSVSTLDTHPFEVSFKDQLRLEKQDRALAAVLGSIFFFALLGNLFFHRPTDFQASSDAPKISSPVIVKLSPTQVKPQKTTAANESGAEKNAKPASRLDQLKNLASLGKSGLYFRKAARLPTSIGPKGRLPFIAAGVGRLEGSTTDWKAVAGAKVSGKVGGGGLSGGTGMGTQLSAGNMGADGVHLLEQEGEVTGGLDREVIASTIRKNIGHILYCYER
ncbi:MAG: hypothetical protein C5B49_15125, partial [Bdellovibrio sp.]